MNNSDLGDVMDFSDIKLNEIDNVTIIKMKDLLSGYNGNKEECADKKEEMKEKIIKLWKDYNTQEDNGELYIILSSAGSI